MTNNRAQQLRERAIRVRETALGLATVHHVRYWRLQKTSKGKPNTWNSKAQIQIKAKSEAVEVHWQVRNPIA